MLEYLIFCCWNCYSDYKVLKKEWDFTKVNKCKCGVDRDFYTKILHKKYVEEGKPNKIYEIYNIGK